MALLGIENSLDDFRRIMEQAEDADRAFRRFQDLQDSVGQSAAEFRTAKETLEGILKSLRSQLDRFLAGQYDQKNLKNETAFQKWKQSHEPFHWFVEFYGIMNGGGVDVIVGNPPYVEYKDVKLTYRIKGFETELCGDLYGYTMERAYRISSTGQWLGMIVPISIFGLDGFSSLQSLTRSCFSNVWCSFYSNRPSQLFDGAQKRLTILIGERGVAESTFFTSRYHRWLKSEFDTLFKGQLEYGCNSSPFRIFSSSLEKIGSDIQTKCLEKITARSSALEIDLQKRSDYPVYYTRKFGYFLAFLDTPPKVRSIQTGAKLLPTELKEFWFSSPKAQAAAIGALSSSCFFWFWNVLSDCRNLNRRDLTAFPWAASKMDTESLTKLSKAGGLYLKKLRTTSHEMEKSGLFLETFEYRKSKVQLDEIDTILASHYGFTPEELDFIINYDIKYRMGLGGGSAEEDDEP